MCLFFYLAHLSLSRMRAEHKNRWLKCCPVTTRCHRISQEAGWRRKGAFYRLFTPSFTLLLHVTARGHKQSSHFPTDPKSSAVHFPWLSLGAWTWISTADHRKLSRPRWIYGFYRGSLLETLCSTKLCVIHFIWFCCAFGDAVGAVNEGEVASGRKSRRDVGKPSGHDKSLMTRHYIEISVWKQLLLSSLVQLKTLETHYMIWI